MPCHDHDSKKESSEFIDQLVARGLRLTKQRQILVREILKFHGPFSAEELVDSVNGSGVDRATVYRTLSSFVDLNLLLQVDFLDQVARFEPNLGAHHHHVVCTSCHKVEPLKSCFVSEDQKRIERMGYKNVTHRLEFFGTCRRCAS